MPSLCCVSIKDFSAVALLLDSRSGNFCDARLLTVFQVMHLSPTCSKAATLRCRFLAHSLELEVLLDYVPLFVNNQFNVPINVPLGFLRARDRQSPGNSTPSKSLERSNKESQPTPRPYKRVATREGTADWQQKDAELQANL